MHDITVGEQWTTGPFLRLNLARNLSAAVDEAGRPIGVIEAELPPVAGATRSKPLVEFGGLVVGALSVRSEHATRAFSFEHRQHDGNFPEVTDDYPPSFTGVVQEIWGVDADYDGRPGRVEVERVRSIGGAATWAKIQRSGHRRRSFGLFVVALEIL